MRSYNFVVNITPDIEDFQYRIRAIDFDQQSYEGKKNLYLPQFFKENIAFVDLCMQHLNKDSIEAIPDRGENDDGFPCCVLAFPPDGIAEYYVER